MKASFINKYGDSNVIEYGDVSNLVLTKNKLLIEVKAISINPVDFKMRGGRFKLISGSKFPKILGIDFSGIVVEKGMAVSDFKIGDKVYGFVKTYFGNSGTLAEFVLASPQDISCIPNGMSFEQAATLPVAALTVLDGFRKSGNLTNKTILINGATGGVGHFAVQIAKALNANVYAVCSSKNFDLAKQHGAVEFIDYSKMDLLENDIKFDIIFDAYGQMNFKTIIKLLKKNGTYTSTLFKNKLKMQSLFAKLFYNKKLKSANMRAKKQDFKEIETLFLENKFTPYIENTFTLQNTKSAFQLLENGKPRGKIVIKI